MYTCNIDEAARSQAIIELKLEKIPLLSSPLPLEIKPAITEFLMSSPPNGFQSLGLKQINRISILIHIS